MEKKYFVTLNRRFDFFFAFYQSKISTQKTQKKHHVAAESASGNKCNYSLDKFAEGKLIANACKLRSSSDRFKDGGRA